MIKDCKGQTNNTPGAVSRTFHPTHLFNQSDQIPPHIGSETYMDWAIFHNVSGHKKKKITQY